MGDITLPLSKLLLDERNPRHRPVPTQEAALNELFRRGPGKLLNLTRDIATNGLSPIDRLIVMRDGDDKRYIVLEGNRRLAALRLLSKPQLCPNTGLRPKFEEIASLAAQRPKSVRCFEVGSRREARPLLDRRHAGEMEGVGVVRWSAMQRTRNATSPGHQERVALATLDWLDGKSAAGASKHLADLLDEVAEEKFTTFGRLAGDPDFRAYAGFDIKGDIITLNDSTENVVLRLSMVLEDFRGKDSLTVTQLKNKGDRQRYIDDLRGRIAGADEGDGETGESSEDADDDVSDEESDAGRDPTNAGSSEGKDGGTGRGEQGETGEGEGKVMTSRHRCGCFSTPH